MKRILTLTVLLAVVLTASLTSCDRNSIVLKTGIEQEFQGNLLITKAFYDGEKVWEELDIIRMDTDVDIKCQRRKQGLAFIEKFKAIDAVKCE